MCGAGADWILSATPYYNKPTQEGLYRHFTAVLEASTKPVCLYNVPSRTAVNLKPETALRLAQHPRCRAIKEASGDLRQAVDLVRGRPDDFSVLSGEDWLALALIASGGDGLISVVSNEVPAATTMMVHLALSGELENARGCLHRLLPLMDANFVETNPAPVKAALTLMGRIENVLRLPLVPVTDSTRTLVQAGLRFAGVANV
jgi:4-hydroxy-tetrahydrodipicolinate synthase